MTTYNLLCTYVGMDVYVTIRDYMHAQVHTHTHMHTWIHTYIIHEYIKTYVHLYAHITHTNCEIGYSRKRADMRSW